jgi:hypothetical protein
LHRFNRLALTAECAAVERLDLVASAGAFFDFLGKRVNGHTLVGILRYRDADPHIGLRCCAGHQARSE